MTDEITEAAVTLDTLDTGIVKALILLQGRRLMRKYVEEDHYSRDGAKHAVIKKIEDEVGQLVKMLKERL